MFHRILVGVDGSPEGYVALEQALRLLARGGSLTAAVVSQEHLAVHAGPEAPRVARELHAEAEEAVARAHDVAPEAETRILHGRADRALLAHAAHVRADLLAVGSHRRSRTAGILLGSVVGAVLHEASAAVLVARHTTDFPGRVVAGIDGSRAAEAVARAARELGDARMLVAQDGVFDPVGLVAISGLTWDPRSPVDALVAASAEADLLVLGSRGLHGIAALGSVSERVAHRARCSVLVLRAESPAKEAGTRGVRAVRTAA